MKKEANANTYFTLVQKALLFSMTSAFILVPGCNCGGEEEPAQAKLTITEPADEAEFTASQDEDPFTDGIQITVKVKVENEIEGQEIVKVSLANDQGTSIDAKVVDGKANFVGVTIAAAEGGQENKLEATATNATKDSIKVTGTLSGASCSFTTPAEADEITTDADTTTDGFQLAVAFTCQGDTVEPTAEVELLVNTATVLPGALESGAASFSPTIAASGNVELLARLKDRPSVSSTITVNVQIPVVGETPYCNFTAPTNNSVVDADVNTDTEGFQFAAEVTCGGVLSNGTAITNQNVRVAFNGGSPITTALAEGGAALQFTATTEGEDQTLSVELETDSTVTNSISFDILIPCMVSFSVPADGTLFNGNTDDSDAETEGFQTNISVTSPNCGDNQNATATLTVGEAEYTANFVSDTADFNGITLPEGLNTLTAQVGTALSAGAPVSIAVVVDSQGPQNPVVANAAICGDVTFGDGCFNIAHASTSQSDYVQNIVFQVDAESGVCTSFTTPTLVVDSGDSVTPVETDGQVWSFDADSGKCRAIFTDVLLIAGNASPNGTYNPQLVITVADLAANTVATNYNLGIDVQPPTLIIQQPNDNVAFNSDKDDDENTPGQQVGVTMLAGGLYDGAPVFLLLDNEVVNTVNYDTLANPFTGMVTVAFDGTFVLKAQSADRAGNLVQTDTRTFEIDVTAPEVASVSFGIDTDGNGVVPLSENNGEQGPVTTSVTVVFNDDAILEANAQVLLSSGGSNYTGVYVSTGVFTFFNVSLSQGSQSFVITAQDNAGNSVVTPTSVEPSLTINVDTIPPACAFSAPAGGDGELKNILLKEDDKDGDLSNDLQVDFVVLLDESANGQTVNLKDGGSIINFTTVAEGAATFADQTPSQGAHVYAAECVDNVGNTATSDDYSFIVDTQVPELSLLWLNGTSPTSLTENQTFNYGSDDADATLAGFQMIFRINYSNVDVLCPTETNTTETCKIQLYTSSQGSPVLAPVAAGETFVDMTLTYNSNRANELIWAVTSDANGNMGYAPLDVSGALAKAQVNLTGLQDYGCDATFANLSQICGGDGQCQASDDADPTTAGFQADLQVSSSDCAEASTPRSLTLKVNVDGTTDFVDAFTPGDGTLTQTLRVTLPEGSDIALSATIEEAGQSAASASGSLSVDVMSPSELSSVLFEDSTQSDLTDCSHPNLEGSVCFSAVSADASSSEFDYARGLAVLAAAESASCGHLQAPSISVDSGEAVSGSAWSLVNSQTQCRSEFSNTILVAGTVEPDNTSGVWSILVSDLAGNAASVSADWIVDRLAPTLSLAGPSSGSTGESLTYTVASTNLDAGENILLFSQTLGNIATGAAVANGDTGINVTFFNQASQNLWVEAVDMVGNSSSTQDNLFTTNITGGSINVECGVTSLIAANTSFSQSTLDTSTTSMFNTSYDHDSNTVGLQAYLIVTVGCNVGGATGTLSITAGGSTTTSSVQDGDILTLSSYSLPEGANDLTFNMAVGGAVGDDVVYPISVDTSKPANLFAGFVKDSFDTAFDTCAAGYADHCLLASATSTGATYVQTLYVTVDPENGTCPFNVPVLTVSGGANIEGSAFALTNGACRATFADVELSDVSATPDNVVVPVTLSVGDENGNTATWANAESDDDGVTLGIDLVVPTLSMTVNDATDDHTVTATSEAAVTVNYVVANTGLAAGQRVTLYVNNAAQPTQTVSEGSTNTFSVQYTSDGTRAIYARASDTAGNQADSNTINTAVTGYNSPLCNATLQSLNDRQPVNGLSVSSSDGSAGSTGFQVPMVVLASKSLSSGSYSCTNSTISVTVRGSDGATFYENNSQIVGSNGTGTVYIELPQGAATISAEIVYQGVPGQQDSGAVTVDTVAPSLESLLAQNAGSVITVPACSDATLADFCFIGSFESDSESDYQKSLVLSVPAEGNACPFGTPTVQVADGNAVSGSAWTLEGQSCRSLVNDIALISGVSKYIDVDGDNQADDGTNPPDGTLVAVTIGLSDSSGNATSISKNIAVDLVPPSVNWPATLIYNYSDDQEASQADSQIRISMIARGMNNSNVYMSRVDGQVLSDYTTGLASQCSSISTDYFQCIFYMTLGNGLTNITATGFDRAGNALLSNWANTNHIRQITVDNIRPAIADITISADQDFNNVVSLAENNDAAGDASVNVSTSFLLNATLVTSQPGTLSVASVLSDGSTASQELQANTTSLGGFTKLDFDNVVLPNGSHTLTVNVSDAVGNNVDDSTNTKTLVIDTTAPGCVITGSRPNPLLANPVGDTVHDSDLSTEGLQYFVQVNTENDNASIVIKNGDAVIGTANSASGYTGGVTTFNDSSAMTFASGSHDLSVICTDAAGNVSTSAVDNSCGDNTCCAGTCYGDADDNYAFTVDDVPPFMVIQGTDSNGDPCGTSEGDPCTGGTQSGGDDCVDGDSGNSAACVNAGNFATHPTGTEDFSGIQRTYQVLYKEIELGQKIYLTDPKEGGYETCQTPDGTRVNNCVGVVTVATEASSELQQTTAMVTFTKAGSHEVSAYAIDASGNEATGTTFNIIISVPNHSIIRTFPTRTGGDSGALQIAASEDTDTETAGAQVVVTATTDAPDGANATLWVGSDASDATALTQATATTVSNASDYVPGEYTGSITFPAVTFNDGQAGYVEIRVDSSNVLAEGEALTGTGGAEQYSTDMTAPTLSFATPSIPGGIETVYLTKNAPEGVTNGNTWTGPRDNNAESGYQSSWSMNWLGCATGGSLTVTAGSTTVGSAAYPGSAVESVGGTLSVSNISIADADGQTITASCADTAGNTTSVSFNANVDTILPSIESFSASVESNPDGCSGDSCPHANRRGAVTLAFTEPGDDGVQASSSTVSVSIYSKKDSAITLSEMDLYTAESPGALTPIGGYTTLGAGTAHLINTSELAFDATWHFGMSAKDDVGNFAGVDSAGNWSIAAASSAALALPMRTLTLSDDANENDYLGQAMSANSGDLNGDGFDDLVLGAWNRGTTCYGGFCNGALEILYGAASDTLAARSFTEVLGEGGTNLGYMVGIVPSINNDTYDDLVVTYYHPVTITQEVVIFYGSAGGIGSTADAVLKGVGNYSFGQNIQSLGDINGDGRNDFGLGDNGKMFVVLGRDAKLSGSYCMDGSTDCLGGAQAMTGSIELNGPSGALQASGLGDTNSDGNDDFVVSASAQGSKGTFYVVQGQDSWLSSAVPATLDLTSDANTTAVEAVTYDNTGTKVSSGDFNGDGHQDFLGTSNENGVAIFLNNGAGGFAESFTIAVDVVGGLSGYHSALFVGNVNGDSSNRDDLLIAGSEAWYLFLGSGATSNLTADQADVKYQQTSANTFFLGAAGDLDNDGFADFVMAKQADNTAWMVYDSP
jgi:hypothetical protein